MSRAEDTRPLVLVADDDELMRLMISEAAESAGFEVELTMNGQQAVDRAADVEPDVVLLDVNMPELDGFAACQALRAQERFRLTPIVMVTGDDDPESIDRAYECGATDFVAKPINWPLLAHRLKYILRGAENLKALDAREQRIHRLAYYDDLTGLPNRALLREHTTNLLEKTAATSCDVALVHMDLDGFKRINDSFGYQVGDKMLKAVARRLSTVIDADSAPSMRDVLLARVGGDEYLAVFAADDATAAAARIAARWIEVLREPFVRDGNELHMTPSIGYAVADEQSRTFDVLLKNAGTAMYASKAGSPGSFVAFCESMRDEGLGRVQLESALREALRDDRLEMHYQPKYAVADGAVAGLEALLRWNDPARGWVSPQDIVSVAEEAGLILDLNRWVVDAVARQLRDWQDAGLAVPVAVNVSGTEFLYGDPVALIVEAAHRHGVDPALIEVEITESTLLHDVDRTCAILAALKARGITVSVDDFGTGYSSLAYLKRFDIDTLKIDRSFVEELGSNEEDRSICRAMLALAKSLSLAVVAEGVETFEQHSWLAAHDCNFVQGYFWSRPLPADEISGLLFEAMQSAMPEAVQRQRQGR